MKKILIVLVLVLIAGIFSGCWTVTYYRPGTATDNKVVKSGESKLVDISKGRTESINTVAKNAGITKIATIDFRNVEYHNIFALLGSNFSTTLWRIDEQIIVGGE